MIDRLDQKLKALERANYIRTGRARLREEITADPQLVFKVIRHPPDCMKGAKLNYVLRTVPGIGEGRATAICRQANISPLKHLQELTERQRGFLIEVLKKRSGLFQ